MTIAGIIRFQVRPDKTERFLALLNAVLDRMRHEDTFIAANLLRSPADPCSFLLHETWADLDDVMNVQMKRPYRDAWHTELANLLVAPRDIQIWSPLRSDLATGIARQGPE